ncbi:hypothetical protein ACFYOT_40995, partial [Saccharothrix saharensis]|uniref:hypothetical protein n=1 Tax=Saccharothrix saharensis TaxID=571190 RepID=UPI0036B9061D
HPDGTTTRTSDDGFAPGTKDTDKTDLDPTDARDRGKNADTSWQETPDQPSGRTPRQKIDDPVYFDKHYVEYTNKDGKTVIARRPEARTDLDGKETHKLYRKDGELHFSENRPPPLRPDFDKSRHERFDQDDRRVLPKEPEDATTSAKSGGDPDADSAAPPPERPSTERWREENHRRIEAAMAERNAAAEHHQKTAEEFDDESREMKDAMSRRRDAGEVLGEAVGEHALRNRLAREYDHEVDFVRRPDPDNPDNDVFDVVDPNRPGDPPLATVRPLHQPGAGGGEFDQVFEITPRGEVEPHYVVQEAKGPEGDYSARTLPDGTRVNQGRRDYFEDVLTAMSRSEDAKTRQLAANLRLALLDERVEYVEVRARIDREAGDTSATYAGFDQKPVNLYPPTTPGRTS